MGMKARANVNVGGRPREYDESHDLTYRMESDDYERYKERTAAGQSLNDHIKEALEQLVARLDAGDTLDHLPRKSPRIRCMVKNACRVELAFARRLQAHIPFGVARSTVIRHALETWERDPKKSS